MASRRRTGLDDVQLASLRSQVTDGKRPRVTVAGPQFGDGTTGTIVRIGDPAADGPEFIAVRVKVDKIVDELLFAPSELSSSVPGAPPPPKPAKAAPRMPRAAGPAPSVPSAEAPSPAAAHPAAAHPAAARPAVARAAAARPAAPATKRRASPPRPVTITITSSGATWAVTATRGSRIVAKQVAVTPGSVSAIGKLIANAEVLEAIAEINDTARAEAEDRAAQLRAELNAVEAVLAAHKAPR